jgi:hypothetical protein
MWELQLTAEQQCQRGSRYIFAKKIYRYWLKESKPAENFGNIMKYILNTTSANYGNMFTVEISSLFLSLFLYCKTIC